MEIKKSPQFAKVQLQFVVFVVDDGSGNDDTFFFCSNSNASTFQHTNSFAIRKLFKVC